MKPRVTRIVDCMLACAAAVSLGPPLQNAVAQDSANPPYLNPQLSPDWRAPACSNQYLLQDQLRGKWGFQGYVVSDCDAVRDVAANHRYPPTQAQGAAISVIRGMDNLALWQNWTVLDGAKYCICQARLNRIYWQNSVNSAMLEKGLKP